MGARCSFAISPRRAGDRVVLYVHGGTFPSGLSIAYRFDGRSWRDGCAPPVPRLGARFSRFRPAFRSLSRDGAAGQRDLAARSRRGRQPAGGAGGRFIGAQHRYGRLSIVAHSWGTIVTGLFAGRCPELVDRLVFFGPIARREPAGERIRCPAGA